MNREPRVRGERQRLLALQADLDIAFTRLRMAEAEIHGGKGGHASELIAQAILTHKTTVKCLGSVPAGFEEEKRELQASARRLFEAIRQSEREYGVLQVTG